MYEGISLAGNTTVNGHRDHRDQEVAGHSGHRDQPMYSQADIGSPIVADVGHDEKADQWVRW